MRIIGGALGWTFKRVNKSFRNLLSYFIRLSHPVQKGRVVCWAYNFKQYSCNPRYLSEYLFEHYPNNFDIYWVVRKRVKTEALDKRVKFVRFRSWKYHKLINTAEFLITNSRTDPYEIFWSKRPRQKYLMLWHGGVALKKIELDALEKLGYGYRRKIKIYSKIADLMISGSRNQTELIRRSFGYDGEILEHGYPRNDIFFKTKLHTEIRERICRTYNIPAENKIILYAPTFRKSYSIEPYRLEWERILPELKKYFAGKNVSIFLRLHPNLIHKVDTRSLINSKAIIDMTLYHDMQELLCISDILITDYSSSMFDFPMQGKPCLLYAPDIEEYNQDRGTYFNIKALPFPLAETEEELITLIRNFDEAAYRQELNKFYKLIGLFEKGKASENIAKWMVKKSI